MIKVGIVDDNTFLLNTIQEKLSFFPEFSIKIRAVNGEDLLAKLSVSHNLDLILMDIEMPKMDGIEATRQIKNLYPQIKIIMLTVFDDDENIFNSIRAGADGYLLKEIRPDDLHKAILETMEGGASMTPSIALKALKLLRDPELIQNMNQEKEDYKLSAREIEILDQISTGLKYNKIAENLFLSVNTVRKHVVNIYEKLQVHNKLEAVQKAKNNRLI
ncbi:MAG: response regulator [Fluviicola sp.]